MLYREIIAVCYEIHTERKLWIRSVGRIFFVCFWRDSPHWARASSFTRFLDHTQRHTTLGRTPLDEWSAPRTDLYPTTHNTHNRQTLMPPVGFEPAISAGERPQTYAVDRAATGTGGSTVKRYLFERKEGFRYFRMRSDTLQYILELITR
jgi:hypothetical protein